MVKEPAEKVLFEKNIVLNNRTISGDHDYAFILMGENGMCAMLEESGLCSLHKKYGAEVLGNVCTMFPRIISRNNDTIELSGSLSCPEVVRRCINADDPLRLKPFKSSMLPRSKDYPIQREVFSDGENFYSDSFAMVRDVFLQIMGNEKFDLNTRLYALLSLANRLSTFHHRGCDIPDSQKLKQILDEFQDDSVLIRLGQYIRDYELDSPIGIIVVHSILSIKLQQEPGENTSQVYSQVLGNLPGNDQNLEALLEIVTMIKNKLTKEINDYIEEAISRYIINCIYREWFITMPDSFTYMQRNLAS